ncbi:Spo11/DNA topoisomerase VI subunit A [Fusarium venenatum]|uniref:Spo11/DNA topoisomerase VI subunit A n=1 Tax=Fusarium venenatum TaxID=56646 RepID=UPI001D969274|nr:Spo11/DNA topoisomerase VI subunit A [Fusarium venenatum]
MDEEPDIDQTIAIPEFTQRHQTNLPSSLTVNDSDTNTILHNTNVGSVVARIEGILEQIIDALAAGQELSIAFSTRKPTRRASNATPEQVHFPGRNKQEAIKFARIILILQLSHDALVSGTVLTKRHIFYQRQDLFEKQREVDELVDDIAFTLGISRGDLNIVAASKGVLAGPLTIGLHDGSMLNPCLGDLILVVEKDAVFRSLCSSQFWRVSLSGPGVLVTAKGYPDLTTRSFLNFVSTRYPQLPILGLFDYDPDGVKIRRCYQYGSDRLSHEADLGTETLEWLGIKSTHLFRDYTGDSVAATLSQSSQSSITSTSCRNPVSYMSARERNTAISTLKKIFNPSHNETEVSETKHELQLMLVLGVKAEIEWLDESGDLFSWLDGEIGEALISDTL